VSDCREPIGDWRGRVERWFQEYIHFQDENDVALFKCIENLLEDAEYKFKQLPKRSPR